MNPPAEENSREILWEHLNHSAYRRRLAAASCCISKEVPSCGDSVQLECQFEGTKLVDIGFDADGCVISQAQASLVCQLVVGRQTKEIEELALQYDRWLNGGPWPACLNDDELRVTEGTRRFPLRHQCLSLVWKALLEALSLRPG